MPLISVPSFPSTAWAVGPKYSEFNKQGENQETFHFDGDRLDPPGPPSKIPFVYFKHEFKVLLEFWHAYQLANIQLDKWRYL